MSKTHDLKKNCIFTKEYSIRIGDINYGNHLGHDSLISILHDARVSFFNNMGYENEINIEFKNIGFVVKNIHVEYKKEVFLHDIISVSILVENQSKHSMDMMYYVFDKNKNLVSAASTKLVCFDFEHRKISDIPNGFKTNLMNKEKHEKN